MRNLTQTKYIKNVCLSVFLQSIMLLLHSQRRYVFEYDQTDRLVAVTMPSMVKHTLQSLLSIGYYRNIHTPPDSQASFVQDFALDGRLLKTQYLGTGRSVIYRCEPEQTLTALIWVKLGALIFLDTVFSHRKQNRDRLSEWAII